MSALRKQVKQRNRRLFSIQRELVIKSRESAMAAVQLFNNPQILFKSELFIVLMCISWTYLLHAFYRRKKIDYRYFQKINTRKQFEKTKGGAKKHWDLWKCLEHEACPIDKDTKNNLKFLIGIRHEIEHQMTTRIDPALSAKFQACCLNFNTYIKQLFGPEYSIEKHLSFSLQFSTISNEQSKQLIPQNDLPKNISAFIFDFENHLSPEDFQNAAYAYRVIFVPKTVNHQGQADEVIEFVKSDSPLAKEVNKTYTIIKDTEKKKYLPSDIVKEIRKAGHKDFRMTEHTLLWKKLKAKDAGAGYGVTVSKTWYWYEKWLDEVKAFCSKNKGNIKRALQVLNG